MPVTLTWLTVPSSLLTATVFVLFHESCETFECPVTSLTLLPVVLPWVDDAVFDRELSPLPDFWLHE